MLKYSLVKYMNDNYMYERELREQGTKFIAGVDEVGRGALSRGGVADYDKVSNIIIRDLKNGYFGNITFDRLDVKK